MLATQSAHDQRQKQTNKKRETLACFHIIQRQRKLKVLDLWDGANSTSLNAGFKNWEVSRDGSVAKSCSEYLVLLQRLRVQVPAPNSSIFQTSVTLTPELWCVCMCTYMCVVCVCVMVCAHTHTHVHREREIRINKSLKTLMFFKWLGQWDGSAGKGALPPSLGTWIWYPKLMHRKKERNYKDILQSPHIHHGMCISAYTSCKHTHTQWQ